jgi:hypothetical protein
MILRDLRGVHPLRSPSHRPPDTPGVALQMGHSC